MLSVQVSYTSKKEKGWPLKWNYRRVVSPEPSKDRTGPRLDEGDGVRTGVTVPL